MINKNEMDKRNLSQVQHKIFPIHDSRAEGTKESRTRVSEQGFFSEQVCLQFDLSVCYQDFQRSPFSRTWTVMQSLNSDKSGPIIKHIVTFQFLMSNRKLHSNEDGKVQCWNDQILISFAQIQFLLYCNTHKSPRPKEQGS